MMSRHGTLTVAAAVALVLSGCGSREDASTQAETQPAPETQSAEAPASELAAIITIDTPDLRPEGIEYDSRNARLLVGSLSQGTVFAVGNDGSLTPVVQDPDLKASVGIEVDEERNRLLVANSDFAVIQGKGPGQAMLGIYDLESGERIAMVDLAAAGPKDAKTHFANDVAVGGDGSAYVTNSMARVVYRVDPENNVSVLLPNTFGKIEQFRFNGIEFHPGGYLLVAETVSGDLYKVPIDDQGKFTKVKLPEQMTGADGIVFHPNGNLLVVRNNDTRSVVALSSTDDWATATIAGRGTFGGQGTTAAVAEGQVYVTQPQFNDPTASPIIERVEIQ